MPAADFHRLLEPSDSTHKFTSGTFFCKSRKPHNATPLYIRKDESFSDIIFLFKRNPYILNVLLLSI